jgi:hypothetical protein
VLLAQHQHFPSAARYCTRPTRLQLARVAPTDKASKQGGSTCGLCTVRAALRGSVVLMGKRFGVAETLVGEVQAWASGAVVKNSRPWQLRLNHPLTLAASGAGPWTFWTLTLNTECVGAPLDQARDSGGTGQTGAHERGTRSPSGSPGLVCLWWQRGRRVGAVVVARHSRNMATIVSASTRGIAWAPCGWPITPSRGRPTASRCCLKERPDGLPAPRSYDAGLVDIPSNSDTTLVHFTPVPHRVHALLEPTSADCIIAAGRPHHTHSHLSRRLAARLCSPGAAVAALDSSSAVSRLGLLFRATVQLQQTEHLHPA